jgi:hypothetical protein
MDLDQRALDIADFLGCDFPSAKARLESGFIANHHMVADDFRAADPQNDEELLEWYRDTDAYIWELSAYHLDEGYNYFGMCEGIRTHLKSLGKDRVLCLGDGVGDLSAYLAADGFSSIYHDLNDSNTAGFAQSMFARAGLEVGTSLTDGWEPHFRDGGYDAIVALDFFEHLTKVEEWANACFEALCGGGQFMAQNAFAIGDDEHGGSIPMHLTRNNRFETDWIPLLEEIGFIRQDSGWFLKP